MSGRKPGVANVTCGCGKRGYTTRKDAKTAGRRAHPGDHMSTYVCSASDSGYWHYGHLKGVILAGDLPRSVSRSTDAR